MAGIAPGTIVLDRYVVTKHVLGTRLADVYRARSTGSEEDVFIKHLRPRVSDVASKRFEREAQMMAKIMHPNVVRLHTYGFVDSRPCLVMEAIDGERLDRILAREGAIAWPDALHWTLGLLSGIEAIHAAQVVHRDIAPANVVRTGDDKTKLANLDLAMMASGQGAVTVTGKLLGIPHYIAPERALKGAGASPLSDVYSVGATLYQMITGRVPFSASNLRELTQAFALPASAPEAPPGFPVVPADVQEAILGAIEVDPDRRTRSARQLAAKLRTAVRASGGAGRASSRTRGSSPRIPASSSRPPGSTGMTVDARPRGTSNRIKTTSSQPPGTSPLTGEPLPRGSSPRVRAISSQPPGPAPLAGEPRPRSSSRQAVVSQGPERSSRLAMDADPVSKRLLRKSTGSGLRQGSDAAPTAPPGQPGTSEGAGSSYGLDTDPNDLEAMGFGANGGGPPPDATHIPGAQVVQRPNVPGGSPRGGGATATKEKRADGTPFASAVKQSAPLATASGGEDSDTAWPGVQWLESGDGDLPKAPAPSAPPEPPAALGGSSPPPKPSSAEDSGPPPTESPGWDTFGSGPAWDPPPTALPPAPTPASEKPQGWGPPVDEVASWDEPPPARDEAAQPAAAPQVWAPLQAPEPALDWPAPGGNPEREADRAPDGAMRPELAPAFGAVPPRVRRHSASSAPRLGLRRNASPTEPQLKSRERALTLPTNLQAAGAPADHGLSPADSSPYAAAPSTDSPRAGAPRTGRRMLPSSSRRHSLEPSTRRVTVPPTSVADPPPLFSPPPVTERPNPSQFEAPEVPTVDEPPVVGDAAADDSSADDDLPIDYSGPDPNAPPDPNRNKRFSTGSSTLRQMNPVMSHAAGLPEDVKLPPMRKTYAALACRARPPAPPATKVGAWLEAQLKGRGGVRILSPELFLIVLHADSPAQGERLAKVITGALSKAFGDAVRVAWQLDEGEDDLERALRPSGALPPLVQDLLAQLR